MTYSKLRLFSLALSVLLSFNFIGLKAAMAAAEPRVTLQRAVDLVQQAEKVVNEDAAQALTKLKEARQLFKQLQQELAGPLNQVYLSPAQLEQEAANNRIVEDLYHTGKRLEASAKEKQEKARQLEAQGNKTVAANLADEADQELKLALQNYCRAEIYSLKNQQLVFETVLKEAK